MEILEGKTYSRPIVSDGSFGQPKGKRNHSVSFESGYMRDNANCFFGNPPSVKPYRLEGSDIYLQEDDQSWDKSSYTFQNDTVSYNSIVMEMDVSK